MKILILLCVLLPLCQQTIAIVQADAISNYVNRTQQIQKMINNLATFMMSVDNDILALDDAIHENITFFDSMYGGRAFAEFQRVYGQKRDRLKAEESPRFPCLDKLSLIFDEEAHIQTTLVDVIYEAMSDWRNEYQNYSDKFNNVRTTFLKFEKESIDCGLLLLGNDNKAPTDCIDAVYHKVWQTMRDTAGDSWDEGNKMSDVKKECLTKLSTNIKTKIEVRLEDNEYMKSSFWLSCSDNPRRPAIGS